MARPYTVIIAGDGGAFKVCSQCSVAKGLSSFCINSNRCDGLSPVCRECVRVRGKEYYENNKQKVEAANKRWKDSNPDKVAEWKLSRTDYNREYQRRWREENRLKLREQAREKSARKRSDPKERVDNAVSCGIRGSIVRGSKRGVRWEILLGYTVDDLMAHLEKRFKPGMSWENYGRGGWHVDHIVPRSAFNYEQPSDLDFKRCWSLSNLQPLWESENCAKNDKISAPFQPSLLIAANDNEPTQRPRTTRT